MQSTSDLYKSIRNDPRCSVEARAIIAGEIYEKDRFVSAETTVSLFAGNTASVGGTVARQLDLVVRQPGTIPRMAEIKLYARMVIRDLLTDEVQQASEWIPKGTFYIDTRAADASDGTLTLHGFDAMLKLETDYLVEGEQDEWPKTMPVVAAEIAARIGVTFDARTVLQNYEMDLPANLTCREVMGYIAAAHAGNWIITDAGALLLVGLASIPPEEFWLGTEDGDSILFGDTRILV